MGWVRVGGGVWYSDGTSWTYISSCPGCSFFFFFPPSKHRGILHFIQLFKRTSWQSAINFIQDSLIEQLFYSSNGQISSTAQVRKSRWTGHFHRGKGEGNQARSATQGEPSEKRQIWRSRRVRALAAERARQKVAVFIAACPLRTCCSLWTLQ